MALLAKQRFKFRLPIIRFSEKTPKGTRPFQRNMGDEKKDFTHTKTKGGGANKRHFLSTPTRP